MAVIATELSPMTPEAFRAVVKLAADVLVASLPVLPDGTLDLTGVRLTYSEGSFLIETGVLPEPPVEVV